MGDRREDRRIEVPKIISVLDLCGIPEDDKGHLIYKRREQRKI